MPKPRKINLIVVHCSASSFGDARLINQWHKDRGWAGIGYHAVVLNGRIGSRGPVGATLDGVIQEGRSPEQVGAHVVGHNANSLGICHIGGPDSPCTPRQWASMVDRVVDWCKAYGVDVSNIKGHCELDPVGKPLCPGIDMDKFRAAVRRELQGV